MERKTRLEKITKPVGKFPYTGCLGDRGGGQWVVVTVAADVFLRSCWRPVAVITVRNITVEEYRYALVVELSRTAVQNCGMHDKPLCAAVYAQTYKTNFSS
jgi:hypothetical protein